MKMGGRDEKGRKRPAEAKYEWWRPKTGSGGLPVKWAVELKTSGEVLVDTGCRHASSLCVAG